MLIIKRSLCLILSLVFTLGSITAGLAISYAAGSREYGVELRYYDDLMIKYTVN